MNKLKFLFIVTVFVLVSLKYGGFVRGKITQVSNNALSSYLDFKEYVELSIYEHYDQKEEIIRLRRENEVLRESAELLRAFAGSLNDILKLHDLQPYEPNVQLVRSIAYANLNDYYKVWVDFEDFNTSNIYGLIHNGNAAGIVVEKDSNPLALLVGDPKSIFSVQIGEQNIPGVIIGKKKEVHVKYIPLWMEPQIGDEVVTSGLDGIFYKGVRVGKVVDVIKEELSKTAIIEPYIQSEVPMYYYVINEHQKDKNATKK